MPLGNQTSRPDFDAANRDAQQQTQSRGSTMVEKDRPQPEPRPSLDLTQHVDRAVFNAAWDREARDAKTHDRAARLAEFKTMRREVTIETRSRTFSRAVER